MLETHTFESQLSKPVHYAIHRRKWVEVELTRGVRLHTFAGVDRSMHAHSTWQLHFTMCRATFQKCGFGPVYYEFETPLSKVKNPHNPHFWACMLRPLAPYVSK